MFLTTTTFASINETTFKGGKILFVGTYHSEPCSQEVNHKRVRDINGTKKQVEIDALAKRLASSKPTVKAIELIPEYETPFNKDYSNYLKGNYMLSEKGRNQISLRLLAKLGHKKLCVVDTITSLSLKDLDEASVAGKKALLLEYVSEEKAQRQLTNMQNIENLGGETFTDIFKFLTDLFKYLNSDWYRREQSPFESI